eukprot:3287064-Alexandrium_andersonii.AAC.1
MKADPQLLKGMDHIAALESELNKLATEHKRLVSSDSSQRTHTHDVFGACRPGRLCSSVRRLFGC